MPEYLIKKSLHPELTVAELTAILGSDFELKNFNHDYFQLKTTTNLNQTWLNQVGSISEINEIIAKIDPKSLEDEDTITYFQAETGEFALNFIPEHCVNRNVKNALLKAIKAKLKTDLNKKSRFLNKNFANTKAAYILKEGFIKGKIAVWQLILAPDRNILITKLTALQNILSYSFRDYEKPLRDNFRGMFPPKLAQIMINLAVNHEDNSKQQTIFDPFCGIGTVNMEALLMNYNTIGSDIDPYAIKDSQQNLTWLQKEYQTFADYKLSEQDATKLDQSKLDLSQVTAIATEGYLGKPRTKAPTKEEAQQSINEITPIYENFFKSLKKKLNRELNICICLPVYKTNTQELVFCKNIVENLESLGYIRRALIENELISQLGLSLTPQKNLLYLRKDQNVGREIIKLAIKI
jgi:tRNA G10  N-methylase Trm11